MKQTTGKQKIVHATAAVAEQETAAGVQGVTLAPPAYGIAIADQQRVDSGQPVPVVQAKLTIGAPDDKYEREADRVAAQVVQQLHTSASPAIQPQAAPDAEKLQLKGNEGSMPAPPTVENSLQQLRGHGQPLAAPIRQPMEQAFGANFSRVRVHTDAQADQLNRSIQAKAFTTGQHLFFRQGVYEPGSRAGKQLLAHELTHVVHQSGGAVGCVNVTSQLQGTLVQRKFDGALKNETTESILRQLQSHYDGTIPKLWQVTLLLNSPDPYETLDEVAAFFKLTKKAKEEEANLPRAGTSTQLPATKTQMSATKTQLPRSETKTQLPATKTQLPQSEIKTQLPATKTQPLVLPTEQQQSVKGGGDQDLINRLQNKKFPTMGRVIDPRNWDQDIKPYLGEYGVTDEQQIQKLEKQFTRDPRIRGIPDLIEMTFHNLALNKEVQNAVKQSLTKTAPDLDTWRKTGHTTVTCGRADTRMPDVIRTQGGFFGWDSGVVSGSHARGYVRQIMQWSPEAQAAWISQWKWPTPDKNEANPWVASGVGSGQKGGGEFFYDLPLIFHENISGGEMIIATDTGNIDNASVIGVRLGGMRGDEIIMLTGIPWKYVTEWSGSLGGKSIATYDANKAADKCENLTKSKN